MSEVALNIVKTDTVIMEYVKLPVISLSYRFLYRFVEPVATVWSEGEITSYGLISMGKDANSLKDYDQAMKDYAVETWKTLVLAGCPEKDLPDEARWLLEVKGSEVHECHIVRK